MGAILYSVFFGANVFVLKTVNSVVTEPYMDEPFHVPQAQAYCRGEWDVWDPKLTTPPGLYVLSIVLNRLFMFKCTLSMLRLTPVLASLFLPALITYVLATNRRERARNVWTSPSFEAISLAAFPVAYFFNFLYYTEVPSLALVLACVAAAARGQHFLASMLGAASCTFRQTNIVWVLYAYAANRLANLRFRRDLKTKLHDPPALETRPSDIPKTLQSMLGVIPALLETALPYAAVVAAFVAFVVWNGGIVLGDKSNHIPTMHIPQLYYFFAFSTLFGWPVLISGPGGPLKLLADIGSRMFGSPSRAVVSATVTTAIAVTDSTSFLLSDNRHYTFYVWRRVFMAHWTVPYLLSPVYLACMWAWFLRIAHDRTILQTLLLPLAALPTLLPTPLLEPRYFLIPYMLLRTQVVEMPDWAVGLEAAWHVAIDAGMLNVFLFNERWGPDGVIRFMW
ncbi:alpha-2-glucosyltransferase Alg10 [Auriculariales sp. MPI-PUGE-AT-0066]|nr:alpha-2-glucosyltransferase Alg10 [Auriculariales sp. MPI-PUGE-AT-0066]